MHRCTRRQHHWQAARRKWGAAVIGSRAPSIHPACSGLCCAMMMPWQPWYRWARCRRCQWRVDCRLRCDDRRRRLRHRHDPRPLALLQSSKLVRHQGSAEGAPQVRRQRLRLRLPSLLWRKMLLLLLMLKKKAGDSEAQPQRTLMRTHDEAGQLRLQLHLHLWATCVLRRH